MSDLSSISNSRDSGPSSASRDASGRIIKKMPVWEPLETERRYVQPHVSHVSVFTGLFSWALRANRLGKHARRPVKLESRRGLSRPGAERSVGGFSSYFSLGTERDLRPRDSGQELNIHRNRVFFLAVLAGVVIYTLVWMTR